MATKIYGETGVSQVQDGIISDNKISSNSTVLNNLNCMRLDNYFYCRDEKASGTGGGTSVVGWQTKTLNTIKYNSISGVVLSNNQITLPSGAYYIIASAPSYQSVRSMLALYNSTNSSYISNGVSSYSAASSGTSTLVSCRGVFTFTNSTTLEIKQYSEGSQTTNGYGVPTTSGQNEVYTEVEIWKLG